MKKYLILILLFIPALEAQAQYWQQHAEYYMDFKMDVSDFSFNGEQELVYTNNSPDTITKVYYHLFFNAFRPGSQMDVRSRTCLLYTSPSPRDVEEYRMPSSA